MVVLDATIVNIALPSAQHALGFSSTSKAAVGGHRLLPGLRRPAASGRQAHRPDGPEGDVHRRPHRFRGRVRVRRSLPPGASACSRRGARVAAGRLRRAAGAPAALSPADRHVPRLQGPGQGVRRVRRHRRPHAAVRSACCSAVALLDPVPGLALVPVRQPRLRGRRLLQPRSCCCVGSRVSRAAATAGPARPRHRSSPACSAWSTVSSNAASDGWQRPGHLGFPRRGRSALLAAFGYIETRARPSRCCHCGSSQTATGPRPTCRSSSPASPACSASSCSWTYYLQETLGFSPVTASLAFLPMVAAIVVCSNLANIVLLPRIGPRFLVGIGHARRRGHGPGLADPDRRALQLRGGCPAGTAAHLWRARLRDVAVDEHRDRFGCGAVRQPHVASRRGQHRPAGRRLHRHVPAQHRGGQRDRQLPGRSPQPPDGGTRAGRPRC